MAQYPILVAVLGNTRHGTQKRSFRVGSYRNNGRVLPNATTGREAENFGVGE